MSANLQDGARPTVVLVHGAWADLVSEFGAEKGLLLDVRMGKENIKYRSF